MILEISRSPGSPFTIEQATWRDLNTLRKVEKICFGQDSWPLFDLIGVLTFPNTVHIKAMSDEQMVGFVGGDIKHHAHIGWVVIICVLPSYRGKGIGTALLDACEKEMNTSIVNLCVRASNKTAINLYQRCSYKQVSRWRRYYNDGEDAVVMEKQLMGV